MFTPPSCQFFSKKLGSRISNASGLDRVAHTVNRRVDRVDRNRPERLVFLTVLFGRHVTAAAGHVELDPDPAPIDLRQGRN